MVQRVWESRNRGLKSEDELGVDVSEAHPLAVLYQTVSLCSGWDSTRSNIPDVVSWPPLLYCFTDEPGGRDGHDRWSDIGRMSNRGLEK